MSTASNSAAFPTGTILGYPRIGRRRELKKAVEAFWAGKMRLEPSPVSNSRSRRAMSAATSVA